MRTTRGRVIVVGDRRQSIYGFRGADPLSMEEFQTQFNTTCFPLSISYRCSKAVIAEAKKLVPDIEAADNAPEGSVTNIETSELCNMVGAGDYILCRVNAPLIKLNMQLLAAGYSSTVLGTNVIPGLIALVKEVRKEMGGFNLTLLAEYMQKVKQHLAGTKDEYKFLFKEDQAGVLEAQFAGFDDFALGVQSDKAIRDRFKEVFSDTPDQITLSTIHKVKGLERDRVFIIRPDLMPHRYAKQEWELLQELNMKYVAITRARTDLIWVGGGS